MSPSLVGSSVYAKFHDGLRFVVKNTFIDDVVDADIQPPQLLRAATAPPLHGVEEGLESDSDVDEPHCNPEPDMRGDQQGRGLICTMSSADSQSAVADGLEQICVETCPDSAMVRQDAMPCPEAKWQWWYSPEFDAHTYENTSYYPDEQYVADYPLTAEQEWEPVGEAPLPRPFDKDTVSQWRSRMSGATCIYWTVNASKLESNDTQLVSPLFHLPSTCQTGACLPCKMMITPQGSSFKRAKGKAVLKLKCEASCEDGHSHPVRFFLSAASGGENSRQHAARGPVDNDFGKSSICGLPKDCEIWDFNDVVDEESQTFAIGLLVLPAWQ